VRSTVFDIDIPELSIQSAEEHKALGGPVPDRAEPPPEESAVVPYDPEPETTPAIATVPVDPDPEPETTPAVATVPVELEPEPTLVAAAVSVDMDPGSETVTPSRVAAAEAPSGSAAAAVPAESMASPDTPSPQSDTGIGPIHPANPVTVADLGGYLETLDSRISRNTALEGLYQLWQRDTHVSPDLAVMDGERAFFRLAAKQQGLQFRAIDCDLDLVKRLDLPVAFGFQTPAQASPVYLVVSRIEADRVLLQGGPVSRSIRVDAFEFRTHCIGSGYLFWNNYYAYRGTIPVDAPRDSILTLKMHLRAMGYDHLKVNSVYDADTRRVVKAIQRKNGLEPDGYVGTLTQIVLYNEKAPGRLPHIQSSIPSSP
jgi:peptidoglycan hydrolase-like protein with peptidoglycan-binding domain